MRLNRSKEANNVWFFFSETTQYCLQISLSWRLGSYWCLFDIFLHQCHVQKACLQINCQHIWNLLLCTVVEQWNPLLSSIEHKFHCSHLLLNDHQYILKFAYLISIYLNYALATNNLTWKDNYTQYSYWSYYQRHPYLNPVDLGKRP